MPLASFFFIVLSMFRLLILASALGMLTFPTFANVRINDLFTALQQKEWQRAHQIAQTIDASHGKGDVLKAFTRSVEAANSSDCTTAKKLSQLVIRVTPGFLPAYEVFAGCLLKENKRAEASKLYQDLSNALPDGPDKELAQQRADALKPDLSPRFSFDLSVIPSSNTSRRTTRSETGNGGALSDESRAQDGVTLVGNILLTKPIFNSGRMLSQISLKVGASFYTVTEMTLPVVGISLRNTWSISSKASVYAAPFFEYTWSEGERFFNETGLRLGGFYRLDPTRTATFDATVSTRNFADDTRDGEFYSARAGLSHILNQNNKIQYSLLYAETTAEDDFFNTRIVSAGIEWQHLFENGFIISLGGQIGKREFDRFAPLTLENREDDFQSVMVGLSHKDLSLYGIRPELTYTYTNQSSNDLFSDFEAHDLGVRLRGNY